MTDEDKKNKIETEGHLTSIITSNEKEMVKDPLSKEIRDIREEIMHLDQSETEKLEKLLYRFDRVLKENCERIKEAYKQQGCPDVEVEPAIGYFIPNVNKQDAILKGAEPSVIVTAKDLSEDGLDKFLLAAGMIGVNYSQDAEILKFPISKNKFDSYVAQKSKHLTGTELIGSITDDNIIPTFEIIVNIPELLGEILAKNLSDNYLENIELYASIIMELAKKQYAASTWPTQRKGFSTIYIKGWDGAGRDFGDWYYGLRDYLNRFSEKGIKSLEGGHRMGGEESIPKADRSSLQGYRTVNELLLIPQFKPGMLSGDGLMYADLTDDEKRKKIVQKLLNIL